MKSNNTVIMVTIEGFVCASGLVVECGDSPFRLCYKWWAKVN